MSEDRNTAAARRPAHTWLIVPCYNEAERLRREAFELFAQDYPEIQILLVNDGSRDGTLKILRSMEAARPNIRALDLPRNGGKAEAVRAGFLEAFRAEPEFIGYWDADLATPLGELPDFIALMRSEPETQMALGARVQLLGRHIRRQLTRHYIGRAFATLASLYIGLRIYDTQCGAKLFRNTALLREVFARPWTARWLFDVEMLVRYLKAARLAEHDACYGIHEIPLEKWEDVGGSKVKPGDFPKAWLELLKIMRRYGRPLAGKTAPAPGQKDAAAPAAAPAAQAREAAPANAQK